MTIQARQKLIDKYKQEVSRWDWDAIFTGVVSNGSYTAGRLRDLLPSASDANITTLPEDLCELVSFWVALYDLAKAQHLAFVARPGPDGEQVLWFYDDCLEDPEPDLAVFRLTEERVLHQKYRLEIEGRWDWDDLRAHAHGRGVQRLGRRRDLLPTDRNTYMDEQPFLDPPNLPAAIGGGHDLADGVGDRGVEARTVVFDRTGL